MPDRKFFRILILSLIFLRVLPALNGQDPETVLKAVFDDALTDRTAYNELEYLCKHTKGRLDGSPAAAEAVEYTRQELIKAGADTVWLQKVPVPHWVRGKEECSIISPLLGYQDLSIAALGTSIGTDDLGITSEVVEVRSFEELEKLGKNVISGKIVFYNRPADNKLINTFTAYSGAVDQRVRGASEAARFGAVAAIVRSATTALDDFRRWGAEPGFHLC